MMKMITNDEKKFYLGVTETPSKERFSNHTWDFKHPKYRNSTELSKYIWKVKDANMFNRLLNEVLLQKCYQKHNKIFVNCVSLRNST